MKKILFTGFDPFGGESTNPALLAVQALPDTIGDTQIIKMELPTIFGKSSAVLLDAIEDIRPDAVVMVGQAGGRAGITIERVAINIEDATMADNAGIVATNRPIAADGPAAYFSTLPIADIVDRLRAGDIPAGISNTAGTFVCNHVMYQALHYANKAGIPMPAGFIHVPYLPTQVLDKPATASMALTTITRALEIIANSL